MQQIWAYSLVMIALGFTVFDSVQAQESDSDKKTAQKVLQRFVGEWEEIVVQKVPEPPVEGSTLKAKGKRQWILDNHMIENKGTWQPSNKQFLHLTTYDHNNKVYRQYYFDRDSLDSQQEYVGSWNPKTKTLTFTAKHPNGNKSVLVERFIDEDNFVWSLITRSPDGQVIVELDAKANRTK